MHKLLRLTLRATEVMTTPLTNLHSVINHLVHIIQQDHAINIVDLTVSR